MALNISTFRTRALTALFFTLIMLAGLLWNRWSFFLLFSVIHFGCWIEYQRIIGHIEPEYAQISVFHRYGVMLAGWSFMFYCANDDYHAANFSLHQIGLWTGLIFLFLFPVVEILFDRRINLRTMAYSALGLVYISLSLALLTSLRDLYLGSALEIIGKLLVLIIIASLWINDTMAYLAGSFFGRTPLTRISPGKTWEGTLGGVLLSILLMGAIGYFASRELEWDSIFQWMIIAAIASITGTMGDLFESKLKRIAKVKDSGHIMPGHGGFLDRFDSLLVAAPCVWIYVTLFLIK